MRNVVIKSQFFIIAITLFAMSFVSCDNEDKIDTRLPEILHKMDEAKKLTGVMHYDQSYQIWYIAVDDNDSLGNSIQRLDVWGRVDPVFLEEGLHILFSGEILQWTKNAREDPLNSGNCVINISHIQKHNELL